MDTEHLEFDTSERYPSRALYNQYQDWALGAGHKPVSETKFGRRLGELNVPKYEGKAANAWHVRIIRHWRAAPSDPALPDVLATIGANKPGTTYTADQLAAIEAARRLGIVEE